MNASNTITSGNFWRVISIRRRMLGYELVPSSGPWDDLQSIEWYFVLIVSWHVGRSLSILTRSKVDGDLTDKFHVGHPDATRRWMVDPPKHRSSFTVFSSYAYIVVILIHECWSIISTRSTPMRVTSHRTRMSFGRTNLKRSEKCRQWWVHPWLTLIFTAMDKSSTRTGDGRRKLRPGC